MADDDERRLCCPYCGADIEANLEYTGNAHSEHRDLTGYECEDYACDAHWDKRGNVTQPSKLSAPVEVVTVAQFRRNIEALRNEVRVLRDTGLCPNSAWLLSELDRHLGVQP